MGRWSRLIAREFVTWLQPPAAAHWLEIGCGTGALTTAICGLGRPASVTACDPSAPLIEHARRLMNDPRTSFHVAGIESSPRLAGGFDLAVSGLVLNFVPDPDIAVASLRDRVRNGGVVAAYVWDYGEGMEFLRIFWDEAAALDRRGADLHEGRRFPLSRQSALAGLFSSAGLAGVDAAALEVATYFPTFDDYWLPLLRGTGPAPAYVASLDPDHRETLRERLMRHLPIRENGSIHLPARAWACRGIVR
jgi:SAM-dependent methyltransferase